MYKRQIYALAEPEDVIQTGMMGLIRAAQGYSPDRHIRFATYAWTCIRNYIHTWRQHLLHRSRTPEPVSYTHLLVLMALQTLVAVQVAQGKIVEVLP